MSSQENLIIVPWAHEHDNANEAIEPALEDELEAFRAQWKDELDTKPVNDKNSNKEEAARSLFIQGVTAEQSGKFSEAITYYRSALHLDPDVENKVISLDSSDEEELGKLNADLSTISLIDDVPVCVPATDINGTHISALPDEILFIIIKWIISNELDTYSLSQFSQVCKGFYLLAKDEEIWRLVCCRVWGPRVTLSNLTSWRSVYHLTPHVLFNGVYISRTTYYRPGEKSLDCYYMPFHVVVYYRFLRFFPAGKVLMYMSPDDPSLSVKKLRSKNPIYPGLLTGIYYMNGDEINMVFKNKHIPSENIYQYRKMRNFQGSEQTVLTDLVLKSSGNERNSVLNWKKHCIHTLYSNATEPYVTDFDTNSSEKFPKFYFSRVKSFLNNSVGVLE